MNPAAVHQIDMNMATGCRSLTNRTFWVRTHEIKQPDGASCSYNVQVLQNFWKRVESHDPETSESYPDPPKNKGHKRRRNGEKVNHGVKLKHEHQFIIGGYKSHEEIGHEEDIEDEVKL